MSKHLAVARRQRRERMKREWGTGDFIPYPGRITLALDSRGVWGPEVDRACLAEEPAVDRWEAGQAIPTWVQFQALCDLTGFPPEFFLEEDDVPSGPGFLCGEDGCRVVGSEDSAPVARWRADTALVLDLHPRTRGV